MTIKFTRFRKFEGSLTKVLSLSPTGELHKDSAGCAMSSGAFETLSISHVRDLVGILTWVSEGWAYAKQILMFPQGLSEVGRERRVPTLRESMAGSLGLV